MKTTTKIAFGLGALCAGVGVYIYMKNKEELGVPEIFSQDFYDDVKDGDLNESNSSCNTNDFVI